ncbi:MAG: phosphoribulokinase [Gammaproteobacteria bacterium]|nr:phosphoribulokinase [Gammaproteobacteria bacterium]
MSARHPIIAVTGSSGSGTSSARGVFAAVFEELGVRAAFVEGDSFHAFDREQMRAALERSRIRGENYSHFGPAANLFDRLQALFQEFGERGSGRVRRYLHTEAEAIAAGQTVGTFTSWEPLPADVELLFYEGLHGGLVTDECNVAQHVDLLVGMTPTVNLEWIQKIHRDAAERGYDPVEVAGTILRRMPDYVTYITPQFSRTDVNFQRVPLVDTSNPFVLRPIPKPEESLVVVHFNGHSRVSANRDELLAGVPGSFLSNPDTLVVPGEHMQLTMQLTLKPAVARLVARQRELAARREAP